MHFLQFPQSGRQIGQFPSIILFSVRDAGIMMSFSKQGLLFGVLALLFKNRIKSLRFWLRCGGFPWWLPGLLDFVSAVVASHRFPWWLPGLLALVSVVVACCGFPWWLPVVASRGGFPVSSISSLLWCRGGFPVSSLSSPLWWLPVASVVASRSLCLRLHCGGIPWWLSSLLGFVSVVVASRGFPWVPGLLAFVSVVGGFLWLYASGAWALRILAKSKWRDSPRPDRDTGQDLGRDNGRESCQYVFANASSSKQSGSHSS